MSQIFGFCNLWDHIHISPAPTENRKFACLQKKKIQNKQTKKGFAYNVLVF